MGFPPLPAYDYPFYGTQWHPEKTPFVWTRSYIPHSPSAVMSSFYTAAFFVDEGKALYCEPFHPIGRSSPAKGLNLVLICLHTARKNMHQFESEEAEKKALIYNYNPVYTGDVSVFQQKYFF